jgi:hypothetical protein
LFFCLISGKGEEKFFWWGRVASSIEDQVWTRFLEKINTPGEHGRPFRKDTNLSRAPWCTGCPGPPTAGYLPEAEWARHSRFLVSFYQIQGDLRSSGTFRFPNTFLHSYHTSEVSFIEWSFCTK